MSDLTNGYTLGYVDGVERERKRIIEMFEIEQQHDPDVEECWCGSWREAIALIKGETNDLS